jgi:hypothetical protein
MICGSKSLRGKTFAQISPLLIEKYKKERRESKLKDETTRRPSTINRELQILSRIFSLAIRYRVTDRNPGAKFRFYRRITSAYVICLTMRNTDSC